jgi:hypothetical protein
VAAFAIFGRLLRASGGVTAGRGGGRPADRVRRVPDQGHAGDAAHGHQQPGARGVRQPAKAADFGDRRQTTISISDQRYWDADQVGIRGTERFDINNHDVGDGTNAGPVVASAPPRRNHPPPSVPPASPTKEALPFATTAAGVRSDFPRHTRPFEQRPHSKGASKMLPPNNKTVVLLNATIATNATTSAMVDRLGFDYAMINVVMPPATATNSSAKWTVLKLQESDTTAVRRRERQRLHRHDQHDGRHHGGREFVIPANNTTAPAAAPRRTAAGR